MKKHLHKSLRALFLSLAVLLSLPMLAAQVEIDGIRYDLVAESKQATVVSKSGKYSGEVVIPESVEHEGTAYSVTSIWSSAFASCEGLTSVTIGNSVMSIGSGAFQFCHGLTSVTIPNSVTSIGRAAFYRCEGLTSVHISDIAAWCNIDFGDSYSNPLYFAEHLYLNGEEVKDLVIPNSVTSIGDYAFYDCYGLTSVTIGNSVESIGDYAFCGCYALTSVTIPNSVTSIGSSAFATCRGLTSVTIGNSVTSIGEEAFDHCSGLTSVTIGNSVTSIGRSAFYYCKGLTSVTIPNSVKSIGDGAFGYCTRLTSVTIPNSVESIGKEAFYGCSGLTSVTIGNSVKSIGKEAFYECSGLTSVTIPNSVTRIGEYAFYKCSGLNSVTIGNSVTSIGKSAFYHCSGLTSVHISDIAAWCNIDFDDSDSNPLDYAHHLYLNGEEVKDLVIPNSVKSIGEDAFYGCSGLTSVTIPNSVTSIGESAFGGCSGLTSVTIGNGVTWIGVFAFANCPELLDVYCYAEKAPSTVRDAFTGYYYLQNATLHVPAASVDSYKATAPWSSFGKIVALGTESEKEPGPWDLVGLWTMTTASGDVWNVTVRAASEDDPDYNNVLYVYGMMGYNWTKLKMHYSYNYDEGKPEVYVKAGELFAGGVNFSGIGVCDVYLYNLVGNSLTTADFTPTVSTEDNTMTIDFGEGTFTGALFSGRVFTGYVWFRKTGVKMTRVIPNEESGETDILNVEADPVIVQANGGVLSVSGVTEGTRVAIYTLSGTMVARATATDGTATISTGLQSGTIVVVKFGNKSVKVRI